MRNRFFVIFILTTILGVNYYSFAAAKNLDQIGSKSPLLSTMVDLNFKEAFLKDILIHLSDNYQIDFLYVDEMLPIDVKVSVNKTNVTLENSLNTILNNTGITYFIVEDQVILTANTSSQKLDIDSNKVATIAQQSETNVGDKKDTNLYVSVKLIPIKRNTISKAYKTIYLKRRGQPSFKMGRVVVDTVYVAKVDSTFNEDSLGALNLNEKLVIKKIYKYQAGNNYKFVAQIYVMPEFSNWRMNSLDAEKSDQLERRNNYSGSPLGFSFGLNVGYFFTKSVHLVVGAGYSMINKKGIHTDILVNRYYPNREIIQTREYSYRYSYLTFPLYIGFRAGSSRFNFNILSGVGSNILVSSSMEEYPIYITQYFSNIRLNSTSNGTLANLNEKNNPISPAKTSFQPIVFSFNAKVDLNFHLTKTSVICLSPSLKYFLSSIYSNDAPVSERPVLLGVEMSFKQYF